MYFQWIILGEDMEQKQKQKKMGENNENSPPQASVSSFFRFVKSCDLDVPLKIKVWNNYLNFLN